MLRASLLRLPAQVNQSLVARAVIRKLSNDITAVHMVADASDALAHRPVDRRAKHCGVGGHHCIVDRDLRHILQDGANTSGWRRRRSG